MNMEKTCLVFPRLILVFYSVTLLKVDTFQVSPFTLTADCSNIISKYISIISLSVKGALYIIPRCNIVSSLGAAITHTQKNKCCINVYFTHRFNAQTNYLLHAMCKITLTQQVANSHWYNIF